VSPRGGRVDNGAVRIRLTVGSIAETSADVLVRVAPANLLGRSPDEVLAAAGPAVRSALRHERHLHRIRRLPAATAVATGAGQLDAPWLVHLTVPAYDFHKDRSYLLSRAYREVITTAEGFAAATVAMPALGVTPPYWPLEVAARVGVETLHSTPTLVREVLLLFPSAGSLEPFAEALARA